MEYLNQKKFSFISSALPGDTFAVVRLKGSEGISRPYEFEVLLVSSDLEIDLARVLRNPARLIFHRESGEDVSYSGILARFEQLREVKGYGLYRARLVPKLWWLSLIQHNQVILEKSLPDILSDVLQDGGLTALDFEFRLRGDYAPQEYVCQYGESHLNFVHRWLEHEGIYYFFEQTPSGEKVVFTDTAIAHKDLAQGKTLYYSPPSGLETLHRAEVVHSFRCRRNLLPGSVLVKDYNYRKPSLEMTGSAPVDPNGRGQVYLYHEHFRSPEEGERLAKVRAEEILCRREEYRGEGSVPYMVPGFTFDLEGHYRSEFNRKYLAVEVEHEGRQTGYLLSGLQEELAEGEAQVYYRNHFTAIPAHVQYRPEAKSDRPRVSGTIAAKIDGAGSGQYAELDEQGRYKVALPFDLSGRGGGKASAWVRMAQPYAGSDHGMHFPLHKGTEVLLTFIDGDPDRPIISGAVPNPETPSPVNAANQTMAAITSSGGNKIHMEDKAGTERILLHSPTQQTFIRIGAKNDPPFPGMGQGPQGYPGPQGPQGPRGSQGANQGEEGPQGSPGETGPQGRPGDTGPEGPVTPGPQGPPGPPGTTQSGPPGPAGAQGPQGTQGAPLEGPPGPQGDAGLKGSAGPEGLPGVQGSAGAQGIQGSPGSPIAGPPGPAGDEGPPGILLPGVQGYAGPPGERGPQGERGSQGDAGERGEPGDRGEAGGPGQRGAWGYEGPQGATGSPGPIIPGPQGLPGASGYPGPEGEEGPQGPQGRAGTQQGPQGYQGSQGVQGPMGSQGPMGIQGISPPGAPADKPGPQGPQGPQGREGEEGHEGPQGPQGKKDNNWVAPPKTGVMTPTEDGFGCHLATCGVLDVQVKCQNEVIIGESTEWVGGLHAETTVIGSFNVRLIYTYEEKIGWSFNFSSLCNELTAKRIAIGADKVSVEGNRVRVQGDVTKVEGNHTAVRGNADNIHGDHTTVRGNATKVHGIQTEITGGATKVVGNNTKLTGNRTKITGSVTEVEGNSNRISGNVTTVKGRDNTIVGNVNKVDGTHNTVRANAKRVDGNHLKVGNTIVV